MFGSLKILRPTTHLKLYFEDILGKLGELHSYSKKRFIMKLHPLKAGQQSPPLILGRSGIQNSYDNSEQTEWYVKWCLFKEDV